MGEYVYYALFDGNEKGESARISEESAIKIAREARENNPKIELLKLKMNGDIIEKVYLD